MLFKMEKNKELFIRENEKWKSVDVKPCFPNTCKHKFFSIRDSEGGELALLESLADLDEVGQKTLEEYLKFKLFRFEITGVYKIEEEFGIRHFEVKTIQGDRSFQMELDHWPRTLPDGSILLFDIYGDQYELGQLEFGQKLIESFIN